MRHRIAQTLTAVAVVLGVAVGGPGAPPAALAQQQPAAGMQVASVVLAHGVKQTNVFGEGDVTPIDPGISFVTTDVPYAIVKVTSAPANTPVTLRLMDPSGVAYSVDARTPKRRDTKPWQSFQFAAPLYILGTDLESRTGTWHFQVVVNNQVQNDTTFEWQTAAAPTLLNIKHALDAAPLQADLHWRYGAALALFKQDPAAIQQLRNAIQLDPKYALYHITLGRIYEREGKKADATSEFQAALGIHGSFYDPVFQSWAQEHLNHLKAGR
ncbi:MAG TPA: tetratricopeptide repeat protein [bacterium]|nr:tetratricopeptide repeat protein [bacterium]